MQTVVGSCVIIGVIYVSASLAVELNKPCRTDAVCKTANSECRKRFPGCQLGQCRCRAGYAASYDGSNKCTPNLFDLGGPIRSKAPADIAAVIDRVLNPPTTKMRTRQYKDSCYLSTDQCQGLLQCLPDSHQLKTCQCRNLAYNNKTDTCMASGVKVFGEHCIVNEDCNFSYVSTECLADTGSMLKTCRCRPGYKKLDHFCVMPTFGDKCEPDVGCESKKLDASTSDVTCDGGVCGCPEGDTAYTFVYNNQSMPICYKPGGDYDKELGSLCQTSTECKSRVCLPCVDGGSFTCQDVDVSNSQAPATNMFLTVCALYIVIQCRWHIQLTEL